MKPLRIAKAGLLAWLFWGPSAWATDYFVSPMGGSVTPFTSWDTAATNIQDAIDAASAGDVVWVTNGFYAAGGKAMEGGLTNRVALDKTLMVRSVNGPFVTTIQGEWDPTTTNGPLAVRCAWLTNGAVLRGFTLQKGATRTTGVVSAFRGGGAWCTGTDATVSDCIISTNTASSSGCGVYGGSLYNCAINGNLGSTSAGAAYAATLVNCTVVSNSCGGVSNGRFTNCIAYYNTGGNWGGGPISYCCITPTPAGSIGAAPQLLPDGIHLSATSPCLAAGTNLTSGTDIDDQPWANPPSIGCDQWHGLPVITAQPKIAFTADPVGFAMTVAIGPQDPFVCRWVKDGNILQDDGHFNASKTTNLAVVAVMPSDAGAYQAVVSNAFGIVTSAVAQVVIHFANAASTNPTPPYLDWATAATNIQDAIDAAQPGDVVLVTNGIYANGGKAMAGDLTNRVALDKPILVQSVNGAQTTTIQGSWDPTTTNGPLAARCAWLTNGAVLNGITLQGGATRNTGDTVLLQSGGGVWGTSTNAIAVNCVIRGNSATSFGGGAFRIGLLRSALTGNQLLGSQLSVSGGGADMCNLTNCAISGNFSAVDAGAASRSYLKNCSVTKNIALQNGGGMNGGTLVNCTVAWNTAGGSTSPAQGGGVYNAKLTNCIVYGNRCLYSFYATTSNYYVSIGTFAYSCTAPLPVGTGNISADPEFLSDGVHLGAGSPCIGAGLATVVTGTDLDGQPWANPPSIGCDEWRPGAFIYGQPQVAVGGVPLSATISGPEAEGTPPFGYWWLKDGATLDDGPLFSSTHTASLAVSRFGPESAGSYALIVSNSFGMATSSVAQVVVHCVDARGANPVAPYSTWTSAATSVQDAIDAANAGAYVILTNGVYAAGGRVMAGDLTNRIAINKPIIVASINGPQSTFIQGAYDPATTNGPLAVRCAWLGQGATLQGLTLLGGATRNSGDVSGLQSGGGAWCASTNELVLGCILSNNMAASYGGGAYQGQLQRSVLWGNTASSGGGAYHAFLANSLVRSNTASFSGGGLHSSRFVNCTVTANLAAFNAGGGEWGSFGWNSIVFFNIAPGVFHQFDINDWDSSSKMNLVSCWTSSSSPPGYNSTPSPQFVVDGVHLAATSPCRGAGNPLYTSGTDLDGESWLNPPSIGCDEFYDRDASGPLVVGRIIAYALDWSTPVVQKTHAFVETHVTGNANRVAWSFGDGTTLTNAFTFVPLHVWTNAGDYTVTFTAYNYDNPSGVTTNALIHVVPPTPPTLTGCRLSGTNFTLSFVPQADVGYVLEQTTNLTPPVTWQTVGPIFWIGNQAQATDSNATNATRFYRVRVQ